VALTPERRQRRARVAALARHHPDRPELADDARRALKAASAEEYIRVLGEPPPLDLEQRARLATLLLGGDAA
jgi:hypothetical protein